MERMEIHIDTFIMKWRGLLLMIFTAAQYRNCCLGTSHFFFYWIINTNVENPLLVVLTVRHSSDPSIKDKPPLGYSGKKRNTDVTINDILRILAQRNIIEVTQA